MTLVIFFAIIFYLGICFNGKVNAAALSISVSNSSPSVGESVKVNISSDYTGRVNLSASGGSLSTSKVWVENNTQSVTLTASSEGKVTINASAEGGKLSNSSGEDVDVTAQAATVTFSKKSSSNENNNSNNNTQNNNNNSNNNNTENPTAPSTKSNNANLKNLGIKPNDFKGFKSGTTTYNATVPNNVEQVNVYATAQDSKASVSGTGNQKLNVGSNKLDVTVTAEDGTKKTYTINVTREEANDKNEENTTSEEPENTTESENTTTEPEKNETTENLIQNNNSTSNSDLKKLSIDGYTLTPTFSPNVYSYTVNVNSDRTSLDIVTEGANHNVSIEVVGNTDLQDGENIITILVYNEETKQNSTYQIMVNKTSVDLDSLNTTIDDAVNKANRMRIILLGILCFIVLCIIIFAIAKYKYNSNNEDEWYEYDDDDKAKFDTKNAKDDDIQNDNDDIYEDDDFLNEENDKKTEKNTLNKEKSNITEVADSIFEDDINEIPKGLQKQITEENEEQFRKSKKKGKHF